MELKKFRNKYDLELIPASHAGIVPGTLVWDPLIGKPKFHHKGMPEHIFNSFLDADLLTEKEWKSYLKDCEKIKLKDAGFAEMVVNVDVSHTGSLEHPKFGKLDSKFKMEKVRKFTFGDLQVRSMTNLLKVRIDDYLEELKKNNWEAYDGNIRRVFMVTELYYGSTKLVIENNFKHEFEAAVKAADLSVKRDLELGKSIEDTFDHENVPFAMRIEKVREFNG